MGRTRLFVIIVTILSLTLFYSFVWASEEAALRHRPPVGIIILDLIVVRPVSVAVSLFTTGICIGTMPLAAPIGIGEQSVRVLIEAPWRFTGMRYLGEFNNYIDSKPITVVEHP
jgi:hypothetical protein